MIKEFVENLKAKGVSEEEIKRQLEEIKVELDEFLGNKVENQESQPVDAEKPETEEDKQKRIFGE